MEATKNKLKSSAGFSLTEMLCCCIVLVILSAMMVLGINLASKSFRTSMADSEAQELCASLTTLVSDELRYAINVTSDADGGNVRFFSRNHGDALDKDGKRIGVALHTITDSGDEHCGELYVGDEPIMSAASYASYGFIAEADVRFNSDSGWFSVTLTVSDKDGAVLAENSFSVLQLNKAG